MDYRFPIQRHVFRFRVMQARVVTGRISLIQRDYVISTFTAAGCPSGVFRKIELCACSQVTKYSAPLHPILRTSGAKGQRFILHILSTSMGEFVVPGSILCVNLFSVKRVFRVFNVRELTCHGVSFRLRPALYRQGSNRFQRARFCFQGQTYIKKRGRIAKAGKVVPGQVPIFFTPRARGRAFVSWLNVCLLSVRVAMAKCSDCGIRPYAPTGSLSGVLLVGGSDIRVTIVNI